MKQNLCLVEKIRALAITGVVLAGVSLAGVHARANSVPFTHLFVFGDSLSDTGNYYHLSGGAPPAPYAEGRFCNGPLWVEYLAGYLGMEYQPADNFAVAGATTGTLNSNDGFAGKVYPGLLDEVAAFTEGAIPAESDRALYIVGAGANDFFVALVTKQSPATLIAEGVNNTVQAVQQLKASGARYILVMNVPDLGVTPMAASLGLSAPLAQLTAAYNQTLEMALDQLEATGLHTIRLNSFGVLDEMAGSPVEFGFTNSTTPFLFASSSDQPNSYLFWDSVHPTTLAHEVLAKVAARELLNTFSPSKGQGNPLARVNSLHGLVNAANK